MNETNNSKVGMERNSALRSSHHSAAPQFSTQSSVRAQKPGYTDLDPDYEGEQFYTTVQRLIDRFQQLDTNQEQDDYGYASEDLTGYVPWSHDLDRSRLRRRDTISTDRPCYANSRIQSAVDIPTYVDLDREYPNDGDFEEYEETGYFRRDVPMRQSLGNFPLDSQGGGYFGVRLSQRKPRATPRYVSPMHGIPVREQQISHQPYFQRSYSLGRRPERSAPARLSIRRVPRTDRSPNNHQKVTFPKEEQNSFFARESDAECVSDSAANNTPPFRRNKYAPIISKPIVRPKISQLAENLTAGPGDMVVLNEIHKRYPPGSYKIKRVCSHVSNPEANGYDKYPKTSMSREKSQERLRVRTSDTPKVSRKGLLKKANEKHVDIVQESSSDMEESMGQEAKIIRTNNGEKYLKLTVDVGGFKPNDIQINTQGKLLQVIARGTILKNAEHPEGATRVYRELKRQFSLPEVVSAEHLQGVLNGNGVLTIQGPIGISETNRKRKSKKVKFIFD